MLVVCAGALPVARAEGPRPTVVVAVAPCPSAPFDEAALFQQLRIELAAEEIARDGAAAEFPSSAMFLRVGCVEGSPAVSLSAARATPAVDVRAVELAEVAPPLRARLLALAASEAVRRARLEPPPAPRAAEPSPSLASPSPSPSLPSPSGRRPRDPRRQRVAGLTAIALASITVGAVVVGSVLAAEAGRTGSGPLNGASAGVFTLGAMTFAGSVVGFGLWADERRRPPAPAASPLRAALAPLTDGAAPRGAALILSGTF